MGEPDMAPMGGKSCRLRMSNLLSSGRSGGGGGGDRRAPAPLCTTDQWSPSLSGVELTGASTPSSRLRHSGSAVRRQEVEGADDLGLAPWRCQRDSASAGAGVSVVIEPVHGKVVLSMVVMLRSPAPDVLRWEISFAWFVATVEKSIRILSFCLRSAFRPETLSLSFERVGRQDSHTASMPAAGEEIRRPVSSSQSYLWLAG